MTCGCRPCRHSHTHNDSNGTAQEGRRRVASRLSTNPRTPTRLERNSFRSGFVANTTRESYFAMPEMPKDLMGPTRHWHMRPGPKFSPTSNTRTTSASVRSPRTWASPTPRSLVTSRSQNRLFASAGRTGVCYDNAAAESFNATCKKELVNRKIYHTRRKAIKEVTSWIELCYNQTRLHCATLRKLTQRMSHYGCRVCGFRGQQYYWQCPGCGRWDSYGPRPGEESVS